MSNASQPTKVSDPKTILRQIESSKEGRTSIELTEPMHQLRVFQSDAEVWEDRLDEPEELPRQVIEVASFLKEHRAKLVQREQTLSKKITKFHSHLLSQHASETQQSVVRQNQIRSLQFHLLQMQNDIIDSQLTMEEIIEHFEQSDGDTRLRAALALLRFEVLDRFDFLTERWENLHEKLEGLCTDAPARRAA